MLKIRDKVKRRLNLKTTDQDELLRDLLEDAEQFVLSYTGRKVLPDALGGAVIEIACANYNILGLEGASSHSEGGVSTSIDRLPDSLRTQLNMYRVAKVG